MSGTPPISIALFAIAALAGAAGQFLYKSGADATNGTVGSYLFNLRLIGGVICYVAVMVLFVAAFRKGGALTVLYPVYASTFIWAALIGLYAYGTPIRPINIAGMALLVTGMFLMGKT
jgi:multidrug transporter EmrE-like cation transporter